MITTPAKPLSMEKTDETPPRVPVSPVPITKHEQSDSRPHPGPHVIPNTDSGNPFSQTVFIHEQKTCANTPVMIKPPRRVSPRRSAQMPVYILQAALNAVDHRISNTWIHSHQGN